MPNYSFLKILAVLPLLFIVSACGGLGGGGSAHFKPLMTFEDAKLTAGQGAVVMHAINRGGLVATRWVRIDKPEIKESFTVFHSKRHRMPDKMSVYDVAMVEPGTYALYSIYNNCEDGLRPASTDWDEIMRDQVATPLGMVSWVRHWGSGGGAASSPDISIWGGAGGGRHGGGGGIGIGLGGFGSGNPGQPVASCNLLSRGVNKGEVLLASITVNPGEVVYAGELTMDFGAGSICENSGNWMSDSEMRSYCGADWMTLKIDNAYQKQAKSFIDNTLGPVAASRTVVRLARPGSLVSTQK